MMTLRRGLLLTSLLLTSTLAHASWRDLSFTRVSVPFDEDGTSATDDGVAVLMQSGGRILAVGAVDVDDPNAQVVGIGLARLDADGAFDPQFAGFGQTVKNASMTSVTDAAISVLGEILVLGDFGSDSALVRFDADGHLDTTFAGDGGTVWDGSGIGSYDDPEAVADVGGGIYVGGICDGDPTPGADTDVYLGKIDGVSGAFTALRRLDRGTTSDRFIDIEEVISPAGGSTLAWLSDSDIAGYAGDVELIQPASGQVLGNIRIGNELTAARGCSTTFRDARSADLVTLSSRYLAVVGDIVDDQLSPVQHYVATLDVLTRTVVAAHCVATIAPAGTLSIVAGAAAASNVGTPVIHLAINWQNHMGYWRWSAAAGSPVPRFVPDAAFAGGLPFIVPPPASSSSAGDIALDERGRAVLLGSANYSIFDHDYAFARVQASARVFRGTFETP